jgi:hypothetical protein
VLRDCEENDITVDWNYLHGFPGETDDDYVDVLRQLPALAHLQPPSGAVRILLERYSPYFERPELGFASRRPASLYRHVYDLPDAELSELVYQFDTPERGIGAELSRKLRQAVRTWRRGYRGSSLTCVPASDGSLVIVDRRAGWPERVTRLGVAEAAAYQALRSPRTLPAVAADLGLPADRIERWVGEWRDLGLIFAGDGRAVALATEHASVKCQQA